MTNFEAKTDARDPNNAVKKVFNNAVIAEDGPIRIKIGHAGENCRFSQSVDARPSRG